MLFKKMTDPPSTMKLFTSWHRTAAGSDIILVSSLVFVYHTCLGGNLRIASVLWLSMCSCVDLVGMREVNGNSGMNDGTVIRIIQ